MLGVFPKQVCVVLDDINILVFLSKNLMSKQAQNYVYLDGVDEDQRKAYEETKIIDNILQKLY